MAIAFRLENLTFFGPKVTFLFLNVLRGGGLEIIPNKYQFFYCIPILEHICTFGSYVSQIRQVANQRWPSHTNSEVALLRLLLEKRMKNQGVSASSPLSEVKALREGADKTSSFSF